MTEPKPERADWERIEFEFRAGILTLREISAQHSISHQAIAKRAKRDGWTRDLAPKIAARTKELVAKSMVDKQVDSARAATERQEIDGIAGVVAAVQISQRRDVARSRTLGMKLLAEVEGQTDMQPLFEQLGEMMREPNEAGADRLNDLYRKIIAMPNRITGYKQLTDALKSMIAIEREAYGLVAPTEAPPPPVPLSDCSPSDAYKRMVQGH